MTIHSGLLFDSKNDSSSFKRFDSRLIFVSEFVPEMSSRTLLTSMLRFMAASKSRTASAPMRASNSSPYCSIASRYASSDSSWPFCSGVMPASTTTNASK